jgi:hypothetical protein
MRWLCLLGVVAAFGAGSTVATRSSVAIATRQACLHAPDATAEQVARRTQLLGFTRHVNTLQAQVFGTAKTFVAFAQLPLKLAAPAGIDVKHSTDGSSYSFSIVDETDPCRSGFFSNDDGVIYEGQVIQ